MIRTKSEVLINARSGEKAIVRAIVKERLTAADRFTVTVHYEVVSEEDGEETFTLLEGVTREFTNEQVDGLYAAYKAAIKSTNFTGIYNELTVLALKGIIVEDGNWGLTINDWEVEA